MRARRGARASARAVRVLIAALIGLLGLLGQGGQGGQGGWGGFGGLGRLAHADIDFKFGGFVSSDLRYRLAGADVPSPYPQQYELLRNGFSRNQNRVRANLSLRAARKVAAVADVELVYYGYSDANDVNAVTLRERVDPYFFEAYSAYVDIYRLLPGLDVRLGRQVVHWGASDQFNPTNNLNTLDYSDPLLFGRALGNQMIRADWNPKGDWVLTAVWVPIFRPAQIPRTAPLALTQIDRPAPVQEAGVRDTLSSLAVLQPPTRIDASTLQPRPSLSNTQVGVRLAGRVLGQDFSLSYYRGRFGIPVPAWTVNRADGVAQAGVVWPRMTVLGADLAGSIEKLHGIGYWIEGAVTFPQEITYGIYNDNPLLGGNHTPVTFDPQGRLIQGDGGKRPVVVPSTPFFKLTVGADYSIGEHVYLNAQYLHGFIDEFGAGVAVRLPRYGPGSPASPGAQPKDFVPRIEQRIGDYFVTGVDLRFRGGTVLTRFFGVFKVPSPNPRFNPSAPECATAQSDLFPNCRRFDDRRFTAVLFPQLIWQVWDSTELTLGAFVFLGDRSTKFGDPAAGATELFAKAKFTF
ncbi:MAG TPA: DUF1302 family protein [Polyangia bacterium]|nr:DUF1302 family protein [Polyangia bacterium]